ncbi:MAG TPA: class I SAM-dependent methyltransferase [Rudaea sp.]|jgi:predicted O-methyltransferase YrrM
MTRRYVMSERIEDYVVAHSPESEAARRLRAETAKLPQAGMQIGADQAAFLALLVRGTGAKRCIEIGTFTGYSALAIAAALPADGRLVCCDISEEWTSIARRHWSSAGVSGRIDLRIGPAVDTLNNLLARGEAGRYDFAFIDADKVAYDAYYEACLKLLRPGGLVALDNMLWSGRVADPDQHDTDTDAIRALNAKICADNRVEAALLTIGDGVMLARKR